jgi:putative membrane protein
MFKPNFSVLASVALLAIATAGCGAGTTQADQATTPDQSVVQPTETTASPTQTNQPTQTGQGNLSASDQEFVTKAAQDGRAEVQLGQMAVDKASGDAVKKFGQRMVNDHTQANNQLQQLATQQGITLPTGIGDESQQVMNQLSPLSGAEFDRQYMNQMVQDHTKAVAMYQREGQQGDDPMLRAWAAQTVPVLQDHLQQAQSISDNLSSSGAGTPSPSGTQ